MKNKPVVLIVDDEKNTREGLARALQFNYQALTAENGARALEMLATQPVDAMLSDIRMPEMDGVTLMQRALARVPAPVCILLTAYGSIETAVEAVKRGAYDFLTKPVNLDHLDMLLARALKARQMERENRRLREQLDARYGLEAITGQSPAMREVFEVIRQVAPTRATVLIEGESGTGKELVARALHQLSPRAQGPFIGVHCAALAPTLLESELFGHEKGAFTGAQERRSGRFELADGGTLLLDEIGEITPAIQVKILRALEERRFERVGGQTTLDVDVRLLAATNRKLADLVAEGKFREDLFFRLNVVSITLPPLRERDGDIPLLLDRFLRETARDNNRPERPLTAEAQEALLRYPWPGNVRELRNVVERMTVLARGDKLTLRDVPPAVRDYAGGGRARPTPAAGAAAATLENMEQRMIRQALESHGGNRAQAAAQLGIGRRTLYRKIAQYGLA